MPVIELDMLIALVNKSDRLHDIAARVFELIASNRLVGVAIPASAYLEYELVLHSRGYNTSTIREDLEAFAMIENLGEIPLTLKIIIESELLREKYGLTFFDSLHAASALSYDKTIISIDKAYQRIPGLKVIDPRMIASGKEFK